MLTGGEAYTITLADGTVEAHDGINVGSEGKRTYTYDKETKVTIVCDPDNTGHNYFFWIKVTFPTAYFKLCYFVKKALYGII
jgi:hypothetical protein